MFKLFGFISSFFPLSHKFLVIFSFLDEKGENELRKLENCINPQGVDQCLDVNQLLRVTRNKIFHLFSQKSAD